MLYLSFLQAEMAKRNSVGSHDMPRQNAFRPAYGTAQDSDDVRIISLIILLLIIIHFMVQLHTAFEGYILEKSTSNIFNYKREYREAWTTLWACVRKIFSPVWKSS